MNAHWIPGEQRLSGTYRIDTYGCQMNAHESEKIAGMLESIGLRAAAPEEEMPDVIVLNTCCIRDSAEQRIRGHIGTLKKLKEKDPGILLCVAGCLSQQDGAAQELARTFPFLDVVLGTHNLSDLPHFLLERAKGGKRAVEIQGEGDKTHAAEGPMHRMEPPLASVNIMYGCNNFCSYCIVPYVRGRERSRPEEEILREVCALREGGYQEVLLLGQNVNSYKGTGGMDFARLLRAVAEQSGMPRIRFMTSHPKDLSDDLIDVIAITKSICSHVHLPVQSGSDAVLSSMNRRYTKEGYLRLVEKMRHAIPGLVLTTDVIVGYPGEMDQDFNDTMDLMRIVRFDAAYTFVYSPRSGTAAAEMECQVPKEVKKERIMRLIDLQNEITRELNTRMVGSEQVVLVEGASARNADEMCGRTDGGKMVNFAGTADLRGKFARVKISEVRGSTLHGEIVEVV